MMKKVQKFQPGICLCASILRTSSSYVEKFVSKLATMSRLMRARKSCQACATIASSVFGVVAFPGAGAGAAPGRAIWTHLSFLPTLKSARILSYTLPLRW